MIRTIAATLAAFVLASFGAFAQGTTTSTPPDTSGTAAKTDTKSDTTGTTKSKKHKKAKKAKKSDTSSAKSDTAATPK
jgi:hypothetical protein